MPKKNSLFSGQKLSERQRKQIEEQLKRSRERDITAMEETNKRRENRSRKSKGRRYTSIYQKEATIGARQFGPARQNFDIIMKSLPVEDRKILREGLDSGDILQAADYIAENYEPGKSGKYLSLEMIRDVAKELSDKGIINTPDDFDPVDGI